MDSGYSHSQYSEDGNGALFAVSKGPTSLKISVVSTASHSTVYEACLARGLLEDDGEWRRFLLDASHMQTGEQLRQLFALLLLSCAPTRPAELWNDFRQHICDDLLAHLKSSGWGIPQGDDILDYGLWLLNTIC